MSIIHMETEQVRELISRLDRTASELLERAESLRSAGPTLANAWQGDAAVEFIGTMEDVARGYQVQAQALGTLARRLGRELDEWEQADASFSGSGPVAVEITYARAGWSAIPVGIQVFTGQEALLRSRLPLTNRKIRIVGVGPISQWNQQSGRPQPGSVAGRPQQVKSALDKAVEDLAASAPDAAVNQAARDTAVTEAVIGKGGMRNTDPAIAKLRPLPKPPLPPAGAGAAPNTGKPGAQAVQSILQPLDQVGELVGRIGETGSGPGSRTTIPPSNSGRWRPQPMPPVTQRQTGVGMYREPITGRILYHSAQNPLSDQLREMGIPVSEQTPGFGNLERYTPPPPLPGTEVSTAPRLAAAATSQAVRRILSAPAGMPRAGKP